MINRSRKRTRHFGKLQIGARLGWEYPYKAETEIPGTVSVSDVKKDKGNNIIAYKTGFLYGREGSFGFQRIGTAVHTVF